jgi:hypothetical protein
VRYATHVWAYFLIVADEYPGFTGAPGFPVDIEIGPPVAQSRWKTFLRPVLALPALALTGTLTGGGGENSSGGALQAVGFLGWFASMARARMPQGMRDLGAYSLGYGAQSAGYFLLLTDQYPNSDPVAIGDRQPLPDHAIEISVDDDLRRSRLTVFFRFLLSIPHVVWLVLWGIAVFFAVIANWVATLVSGQSPPSLHRFLVAYLRYSTHVGAYMLLIANPFPGFSGEPYDVDITVASPEPQNRWVTGFRLFLAVPALILAGALGMALFMVGFFGWFVALALGRMPLGFRNLGAYILRYSAQVNGYAYVLTDSYPYSGPPGSGQVSATTSELPAPDASPALET